MTPQHRPAADRIAIPDPALMRRASRRAIRALIVILTLTALFTVGGISAIANGESTGIPLALGAGALDLACLALVVATQRVRNTLHDHTISRSALTTARRTTTWVQRGAWITILLLVTYGGVRLATDDPWSFITALAMSVALAVLARATQRLRRAQDQSLAAPPTR